MGQRTLRKSFNGGEVTPELHGLVDDAKFQSALALCRNFIVLPHGPVANRAGTALVREVRDSTRRTRLIPFTFSTTQTMVIELGAGYFRFHTQGGTVLNLGVPYEVANSYAEADLFDIHYAQSNDVLTLVHPGYGVAELRRLGPVNWTFSAVVFGSSVAAPTGPTFGPPPVGTITYDYVVTSVGASPTDESAASAVGTTPARTVVSTAAPTTVFWTAVAGAVSYNVYRRFGGVFAFVGSSNDVAFGAGRFVDTGEVLPDITRTPPDPTSQPFTLSSGPGAVSYYQQRRFFGGTTAAPQGLYSTKTGAESNMTRSIPVRDDDAISIRIAAREANTIRHLVPLNGLLALTGSAEWLARAANGDAITPTNIQVEPQSYIGANNVQPVVFNTSCLYVAARGGHVREVGYSDKVASFISGDLSLRAVHLFDDFDIVDAAIGKAPVPIAWFVSSSGKLLGLTYIPEQNIGAWHQHDTDGAFESVCCVSEGTEDVVYVVVRRVINGVTRRFVERMASRKIGALADAFFVDCGATYSGTPTTTVSGLTWLEGEEVAILADGAVHPRRTVVGGSVTLEAAASKVQIGLPITADIQTLPMALEVDGAFGQGRVKNINTAWIRVSKSGGFLVGPSFDRMVPAKVRRFEPYGSPPALKTEQIQVEPPADWQDDGALCIRQSDPLPLTVVSFGLEVALGG